MIALRPQDQHVWNPRPVHHETETNYCETETETKKKWSRDLNIPVIKSTYAGLTEELAQMAWGRGRWRD